MQDKKPNRRVSLGVVAGISTVLLVGGGGTAWWALNSLTDLSKPSENSAQTELSSQAPKNPQEELVQIYWLDAHGTKIELQATPVTIEKSAEPNKVLESAFQRLLAGPNDKAYTTTIPEGTKLLGITIDSEGVHVNLSPEFTTGGGSSSMSGRLAQILYTATSLDPAEKVWIDIGGKPLEVLGGEGLIIDQPMTRKNFEENFAL